MASNANRKFVRRPDYLKKSFLAHIRKYLPQSWEYICDEKPPQENIEVLIQDFTIARDVVSRFGQSPCPICRPNTPQYTKGHLLWSSDTGKIYAVGHCCGHKYFGEGVLKKALTANSRGEKRKENEEFIERNWDICGRLVQHWSNQKLAIRDADKVVRRLRSSLSSVCRDILRFYHQDGFLKTHKEVNSELTAGGGLTSIEERFGEMPVIGVSILKASARSGSMEGPISSLIDTLSKKAWTTQDQAINWLCNCTDDELAAATISIKNAVALFDRAEANIYELLSFVQPSNLELITKWSRAAHSWESHIFASNNSGHIVVKRGHKPKANFRMPLTLNSAIPSAPRYT